MHYVDIVAKAIEESFEWQTLSKDLSLTSALGLIRFNQSQRRPQKFFQGGASDLSIIYWINQNLTAATRILLRSLNQKLK